MKKSVLLLIMVIGIISTKVIAQPIINIPDVLFKSILVSDNSINTNLDAEIDSAEAASYTGGISIVEVGVSDLTGIEAFVNATALYASDNYLTTVDLSSNIQMATVNINYNYLTSFTAAYNPNLTNLSLSGNQLTSFDGTMFPNLNYLDIGYNLISSLDISNNYGLYEFYCDSNELSSLDLSPAYGLYLASCRSNNLTSLNVHSNYYLANLYCGNNPFSCLNLEGNYNLTNFECLNAINLQKLNLKNGNNIILNPSINNCPNLGCVQVDDSAYSATTWVGFPASSYFSNDCGSPTASFTHNAPVCNGTPVVFDQTMTNVESFYWEFGDGSTSSANDPSHLYTEGGNFWVQLNAISCYGILTPNEVITLGNPIEGFIDVASAGISSADVLLLKYEPVYHNFDTIRMQSGFEIAGEYYFDAVFDGQYIIKVVPDTLVYNTLISTYSGDQPNWEIATIINHSCFASSTMDITMLELPGALTGPGSLSGEIIEGAGFGRAPGDPIHGVDVKLGLTASNIVATTTTDTLGQYEFTNVPFGTYTIYVDIPGLLKDSSYTLTIDSSALHWTYLDYIVDSSKVYIIGNVGVEGIESDEPTSFMIYPNPVKDNAFIKYSVGKNADVSFDISNSVGIKLNTLYNNYATEGEYLLQFNPKTLGLRSGVYFITCTMNNKTHTQKIVIVE